MPAEPPRQRGATTVIVVAQVMAAACVAQAFGRFTYGALLPSVRDDILGGSNSAAGLLGTANVGAYLVGTIVVASLSTRLSLTVLIRGGLCLSTTGLLLASVAGSAPLLALALIAMGLGGAAIWIPSPRVASMVLPPQRRGLAAGLVGMGIGIGIVFAGQLADAARHGGGASGWHDVYRIEGLIGIVVLAGSFVALRLPAQPTAAPTSATGSNGFAGFGALRRVRGWAPLTAAYAAFGFMYLLVFAFLVARLEDDAGFSADSASAMFSLVGAASVFGGIVLGPLSDRVGRRATMTGAFVAFAVSTCAILPGRQPLVALGALGVGFSFSGLPSVIAAFMVDATDAHTYAPAYSAATLAFGIAQMAAPQVGGTIADVAGSFTPVFVLSVAVAIFGAFASMRLPGRAASSGGEDGRGVEVAGLQERR